VGGLFRTGGLCAASPLLIVLTVLTLAAGWPVLGVHL
jgi:hypothetical protein